MSTEICNQPRTETTRRQAWRPIRIDITETNEAFNLRADLPGVNKEQLEVSLDGDELTIIGRRGSSQTRVRPVFQEAAEGDFRRAFRLDADIHRDGIKAVMRNGVLFLTLPKPEAAKPRQIEVQ